MKPILGWCIRMKSGLALPLVGMSSVLCHAEPARQAPVTTISFSSAVNWEFTRLEKLDAWRNTAVVLRKSLAQWYPPDVSGSTVENVDREALRTFFTRLSNSEAGGWNIVYLASHQTRDGLWQFPHDREQSWPEILAGVHATPTIHRIVIVDACFAEAADGGILMRGTGAKGILFAALRSEAVHEINFRRRFPLDVARRFPAEARWLRDSLGADWDGRVSFFGLIWLQAFLTTAHAPRNVEDWNDFFHRCETLGREFRNGRGETLATTVRFVTYPPSAAP